MRGFADFVGFFKLLIHLALWSLVLLGFGGVRALVD
jgi:hypothetical protein